MRFGAVVFILVGLGGGAGCGTPGATTNRISDRPRVLFSTGRAKRTSARTTAESRASRIAAELRTEPAMDQHRGGEPESALAANRREGPVASSVASEATRAGSGDGPSSPADVSGVWVWEHRGAVPTGDEKQEREEWHVEQRGDRISGYYDRTVREISTDGQAFECSQGLEFEIATRYRIRGEVRGNQVLIVESSYEVLDPTACDNGQRRLDAYEGQATGDEVRLAWGVGAQVLHRPRPDVPTQHF